MPSPIPVVRDRCRAQGNAGEDAFAGLGDLLDFAPVPRKIRRVDGWTADRQRAFIAALAVTGSPRQAARAVGKAQWGVDRLREAEGAEGFSAAWDKAMAMAEEKGRHRLAAGISAVIEADAPPGRIAAEAEPAEPTGADLASADAEAEAFFRALLDKYLSKLEQESRARLDGRIAEADFYVRQITCLEVSLDMVSGDGMKIMRDFRCRGHDLLHIAETDMSRLLDAARRLHWEQAGEPPRPEHPPRHLLVAHDGFSTEPLECTEGGQTLTPKEQQRIFEERHASDAAAHIEWEAEARRDYERRRESGAYPEPGRRAAHNQEPGPPVLSDAEGAGQPAPSGDRTDVTNSVRDGPQTSPMGPASKGDSSGSESGDSCSQLSPFEETEK
ncbi:MAG TPA: hypothetical protein VMS43_15485 [Allosphingosinicella sp.]|nr:hypothetical protein [Allosphingosinicella sp.]